MLQQTTPSILVAQSWQVCLSKACSEVTEPTRVLVSDQAGEHKIPNPTYPKEQPDSTSRALGPGGLHSRPGVQATLA